MTARHLEDVARMASPDDNVAIAIGTLEAGTTIRIDDRDVTLSHTVLLGHRFAVRPIAPGNEMKSWGRPFGVATTSIEPGEYICNKEMLAALSIRNTGADLPPLPNFASRIQRHEFDEAMFVAAPPAERYEHPATFLGYRRGGDRGTGTRNYVVILGTSSRTAGFARLLADRLQPLAHAHPSIDGIVAVAHTEGGDPSEPNNMPELLRALAGYLVHPNVGAVLAIDYGVEPLNNTRLQAWIGQHDYPVSDTPHRFYSILGATSEALAECEEQISRWLPHVAEARRTEVPMSGLCAALQCGGSDAFSGISGNPLVGAVGHEVVRHGGRMCLTETDELIGAEAYILERVRDAATARRFLEAIERFKTRLAWHGTSAEGNPSGGNKLRGLYNITLKSLGAAAKKSPLTRLDFVVGYAERMHEPGFYFMDGPGNDLEGIAGQAAGGCNLFLFVTGNGSVTNFPFIPTIKVTTTTTRHELLRHEMDVNAGRYLDGEPMNSLCDETFELVRAVASGQRTRGERAGHSQVSIWRNWRQTDDSRVDQIRARPVPDGVPLRLEPLEHDEASPFDRIAAALRFSVWRSESGAALERVGLILPASLCSGQIARMAAMRLNQHQALAGSIDRYVALVHTEGCGFSGDALTRLLLRTYRGYLTHPNVAAALMLEHGCEKIPNDLVRHHLIEAGIDPGRFGWASVQLDGGIDLVLERIEEWFTRTLDTQAPALAEMAGIESLTLGLVSATPQPPALSGALADIVVAVVRAGGSVLLPYSDPLVSSDGFRALLVEGEPGRPTLSYGERPARAGLHLVDTETEHVAENLAGLGGCGAQLLLCAVGEHPVQGHPMLPVLQVAAGQPHGRLSVEDIDLFTSSDRAEARAAVWGMITDLVTGQRGAKMAASRLTDFQITRGYLGVTT